MNGGAPMLQEKDFLTVKDVAEKLETEPYVLRFYEKELNLTIKRNTKGHRVYTVEDVEMFRKILDMREQGLQLKAIESIMHDSNQEAKESYEQLSSAQLPTAAQNEGVTTIDIGDPNNDKVKVFMGMITQAVMEGNKASVAQIKQEMKAEIKQEVDNTVEEKIVMDWIAEKGYHTGNIMNAFRLTLVGEGKGPHMFDISWVLGKEETLARMKRAVEVLK